MPSKSKTEKAERRMPSGSPMDPRESLLNHLADHVYHTTREGVKQEMLLEALDARNAILKPPAR